MGPDRPPWDRRFLHRPRPPSPCTFKVRASSLATHPGCPSPPPRCGGAFVPGSSSPIATTTGQPPRLEPTCSRCRPPPRCPVPTRLVVQPGRSGGCAVHQGVVVGRDWQPMGRGSQRRSAGRCSSVPAGRKVARCHPQLLPGWTTKPGGAHSGGADAAPSPPLCRATAPVASGKPWQPERSPYKREQPSVHHRPKPLSSFL